MRASDFDYDLPRELIAQQPLADRASSRLLVLDREKDGVEHRRFPDLLDYLRPPDVLVINDTKVFPARLLGRRPTGGRVEILLLEDLGGGDWTALVRPARALRPGAVVHIADDLSAEVVAAADGGERVVRLHAEDVSAALERHGHVPLPPYIRRDWEKGEDDADRGRYQTVYAREVGAAAAPTAGLHFTDELLSAIEAKGIGVVRVTLHVGRGTFEPIRSEDVDAHRMHAERCFVGEEAAERINASRRAGGRIVAVGTTSVRVLETASGEDGLVRPFDGWADLFIKPGYVFRAVDVLLTNFHLPRSTVLVLACAFGGRERVLGAYREAIRERYRFYSYGDAMLIL